MLCKNNSEKSKPKHAINTDLATNTKHSNVWAAMKEDVLIPANPSTFIKLELQQSHIGASADYKLMHKWKSHL